MAEVPPPLGMTSVAQFAKETRMDPIKIRRFLKTGFILGTKISNRQWHIPESEFEKILGPSKFKARERKIKKASVKVSDDAISVEAFSKLSGLSSAKVKNFLRTGFLKGAMDKTNTWQVEKSEISKFKKKT